MSDHEPVVSGWDAALGDLETHVTEAEKLVRGRLGGTLGSWTPPGDLGPVPDEFLFRARQLLGRQQALIDAIPGMMSATGDQRRVLGRIADATGRPTVPVYIDVAT
ncbi:MAG TPA: hypothetical protein VN088_06710 [Nocardioides sp.]|nr:hypothetical protein [Nocardioides sp.]